MGDFFSEDSIFMRLIFRLTDIVVLNILFIITCLPVFTIGTAITSMTYTAMKAIELDDGYISKKYFKAFKQNFKQSTGAWIIMLAAGGVLFFDVYFWVDMWTTGRANLAKYMIVFSVIMAFVYVMVLVWLFPIMATFQNTIKKYIWNSLALAVRHFPWTLLLCITAVGVPVLVYFNFYCLVFMVVAGFGALAYAYAFLFKHIFKQYIDGAEQKADSETDMETDEEDTVYQENENTEDTDAENKGDSNHAGSVIRKGHTVRYVNSFEGEDDGEGC